MDVEGPAGVLAAFARAEAAGDAAAAARLFGPGGERITADGRRWCGRDAVAEQIRARAALVAYAAYRLESVEVVEVVDGALACRFGYRWAAPLAGEPAAGSGSGTALLRCEGGEWLIERLTMTPHVRPSPRPHVVDVDTDPGVL